MGLTVHPVAYISPCCHGSPSEIATYYRITKYFDNFSNEFQNFHDHVLKNRYLAFTFLHTGKLPFDPIPPKACVILH